MNIWDDIKRQLATNLSPESYKNWVEGTSLDYVEEGTLHVRVPDMTTGNWLEIEYGELIQSALRSSSGTDNSAIRYHAPDSGQGGGFDGGRPLGDHPPNSLDALHPRYTFENFVVGGSNQFAHAAARSVATNPSRSYNPLFIYGGAGLGKTHLLHAIGRTLIESNRARVVYTSSERFINEVISALRFDSMPELRKRYRSADVLLIDDIQLLGNKERTQEEFFHTFNELHDHQKQIVVTSDTTPKQIPGLVERLRSRFEWGLIADIQVPDLETKLAILDRKAAAAGVRLPPDVREFIASRTKTNIRELEGSLVKLIAYSSLTGAPISLSMASVCLKHLVALFHDRRVTIKTIQKAVADKFGIEQSRLRERSNIREIVYPRQVAMYLAKELTGASLPEIGRAFGGKHSSTVEHSIAKIYKMRNEDPELNRLLHSLQDAMDGN